MYKELANNAEIYYVRIGCDHDRIIPFPCLITASGIQGRGLYHQ